MRKKITGWILLLLFGFFSESHFAQAQFFQFKIKDAGVYKISSEQARRLGFSNLTEISIFGFPGMLPQKLDSAQLKLQEIPSLEQEGNLYFYLTGPNSMTFSGADDVSYSHHLFSDSLSFLLGKSKSPKRIMQVNASSELPEPNQIWYSWTTIKEEKNNLLNSGRDWYSDPIRQGQSLNINLGLKSETSAPWILHGKVMGQSFNSAQINILSGNQLLGEIRINPIPNTTYGIKGREEFFTWQTSPNGGALSQIRFTFQGSGSESAGYLGYLAVGVPYSNSNLKEGVFEAKEVNRIALLPNLNTWEISDFYNPIELRTTSGRSAEGKKWVIFSPQKTPEISQFKPISLSIREQSISPDLLIITNKSLLSSANKLKNHKESLGTTSHVVTVDEIFQGFGYGNPDLTAIRNFIAYLYHPEKSLKNVLILGKGTFDYKNKLGGRPNLVPIYTSRSSLNPLTTFSSDDYLGLVDWGQGEWIETREGDELLQLGVGRLPAINFTEANEMVEKIIRYETYPIKKPQVPLVSFLADDADNNIHVRDAEVHSDYLSKNHPEILQNKLYLDRFEQEKSGTSQSAPQAKKALEKTLENGTLILNYIGHGNETTLTAEEIFKVSDISNWAKMDQLALWVTATCEFGRHDSPFIRSAAEELLFASGKGAVALLTTGRPVFSSVNFALNEAFIEEVFQKDEGQYQDLGRIFRNTKNNSQNGALNRNFSLLGDPSLKLALPDLGIKINSIKNTLTGNETDTLSAFQEIELRAEVTDPISGSGQSGFNGTFQLELRDKPAKVETLGDESSPVVFEEESLLLFKGEGKIEQGKLTAKLFIPASTKPDFGNGNLRISGFDPSSGFQAMGNENPILGGMEENLSKDQEGPEISVKINGQGTGPFIFPSTQLEIGALLSDQSGINVSGFIPGKELSIQVNDLEPIILNESYLALDGSFQKGSFLTTVTGLTEGINKLIIRASDNVGNESEFQVEIEIRGSEQLQIISQKVYPNPANVESQFEIKHNRPGENLNLTFEVYSSSGQILFSEAIRLVKAEEIIRDLSWIFFQSQTKYPAKGTYIYKLTLQAESDLSADSVSGKLVIQ
ncbi:T9SS C-terminal target domain-containing protein [Algoriphagus lacus]|uniref:T9SS C-terminal target domain-containing protein n=1 Tax=Algoriphagus lacus TaxID=2056311 RepID=A0A418PP12_9BACT|nr:type IX secretion system sortase PorU [Algoriphagus lacus]RIW13671.1 T9SS C-terminal target domain-containing protein [Algoriphagus lacus]